MVLMWKIATKMSLDVKIYSISSNTFAVMVTFAAFLLIA